MESTWFWYCSIYFCAQVSSIPLWKLDETSNEMRRDIPSPVYAGEVDGQIGDSVQQAQEMQHRFGSYNSHRETNNLLNWQEGHNQASENSKEYFFETKGN